jgi:adenine-specific DNA-methyltransferase
MGVKVYQVGKGKPKQTEYEVANNTFVTSTKIDQNHLPFISQGIKRYFYEEKNEFINYGEHLAEPRNLKYFADEKVVVREIVNPQIYAMYFSTSCVVKNIAAVIIPKSKKFSLKYLLALLNSKLFTFYVFEQNPKSSNKTYPSFSSELIKNIPIKEISETEQQPFINLVEKILSLKKENPQADTQVFEDEIDELVFGLYGLSAAERAAVLGG